MEEQFDKRDLLDRATLRALLTRRDSPSRLRLALHTLAFIVLVVAVSQSSDNPFLALPLSLILAWIWCTLFAPFHECIHGSAFSTARANKIAARFLALPFLMAPAVYKTFHFEHHRNTQDPERDPELMGKTPGMQNPTRLHDWFVLVFGLAMIRGKIQLAWFFATTPQDKWAQSIPWSIHCKEPAALARESRVLLAVWIIGGIFVFAAVPGSLWLLFAWWFSHVFLMLWISAEHTALPHTGTIVSRTRTVSSNGFVRWWLWNMNFHAEHHAWPGMPWHQLPAANAVIRPRLEATSCGYTQLHRDLIRGSSPVN